MDNPQAKKIVEWGNNYVAVYRNQSNLALSTMTMIKFYSKSSKIINVTSNKKYSGKHCFCHTNFVMIFVYVGIPSRITSSLFVTGIY